MGDIDNSAEPDGRVIEAYRTISDVYVTGNVAEYVMYRFKGGDWYEIKRIGEVDIDGERRVLYRRLKKPGKDEDVLVLHESNDSRGSYLVPIGMDFDESELDNFLPVKPPKKQNQPAKTQNPQNLPVKVRKRLVYKEDNVQLLGCLEIDTGFYLTGKGAAELAERFGDTMTVVRVDSENNKIFDKDGSRLDMVGDILINGEYTRNLFWDTLVRKHPKKKK